MGIESAATFLICTILLGCGAVVFVGVILLINNMLHRYWKDLNWNLPDALRPPRYAEPPELDRSREPPLHGK